MNIKSNLIKLAAAGSVAALAFTACSSTETPTAPAALDAAAAAAAAQQGGMTPEQQQQHTIDSLNALVAAQQAAAAAAAAAQAMSSSAAAVDPGAAVPASSAAVAASSAAAVPASSNSGASAVTPKSSAAAAAADDGVFSLELWDAAALVAAEKSVQIITGNKGGGYWYSYTDVDSDGLSTLEWNGTVGDEYDKGSLTPVITANNGLAGTYDLKVGGNQWKPFVGFAFGYAKTNTTTGDGTAMGGICLEYTSDSPIKVELGQAPTVEKKIDYANPFAEIPAASAASVVNLKWADFAQADWVTGTKVLATATAVKQLSSIKFKIEGPTDGEDGGTGSFLVSKVGPLNGCN